MEVDTIVQLVCRCDKIFVELVDLGRNKPRIDEPAEGHAGDPEKDDH